MTTLPSTFTFQSHHVRTVVSPGQIWFVAKDVCQVLDIAWRGAKSLVQIPPAWQGVRRFRTPSGNQQLIVISEAAVYKLAFRSNKPEAEAFTDWVAGEVLPTIRKTGKYEPKRKALPTKQQKALPVPQPSYWEQCATVTAKVLALRGEVFRVTDEMANVFREPFWGMPGHIPEDKKAFANAMNYAIQSFQLSIYKEMEMVDLLFKAYVEGEKLMRHPI